MNGVGKVLIICIVRIVTMKDNWTSLYCKANVLLMFSFPFQINGVSMRDSDCDTLLPLLRDTGSRVELVVIRSGLYSNDNRRHL